MNIIIQINPHEDGVRCGECDGLREIDLNVFQGFGIATVCELFGVSSPDTGVRVAECLAAEAKLKRLVLF